MATCSIQYIEDLPIESRQEKDRLTKLHLDISKRLYSYRLDNKYKDKVFQFTGSKLFVPGNNSYYNAAVDLIDIINADLGFKAVKLFEDPNVKTRRYVSVDVRPDQTTEHAINDLEGMHQFHKNYFGDSAIITENTELEDAVIKHEGVFAELAESIRKKAAVYLNGLDRSGDFYRVEQTERDLTILLGSLKDKSTYGIIESISKYVITSSHNLTRLQNRLNIINEKMNDLSTDAEDRRKELKEIADFVRHSSYYYHLFDKLEDLRSELRKAGVDGKKIDNYERDLLESNMREWLQGMELFNEQEIIDFLNVVPSEVEDSGSLFGHFKSLYRDKMNGVTVTSEEMDKLQHEFHGVLNKSMKPNGSAQQQLLNIIDDLRPFKSNLKDLHYNTLVEIYYPAFERSFVDGKMSIDGKTPLDQKWKLNKEQFKTLLQLGEEDIDSIAMWGSAMINVKETLPVTIANYFKGVMVDADITNKADAREFQNLLARNGRVQGDDVLQALDSNATMDHLTIDAIEEVPESYVPTEDEGVISIMTLGKIKTYKARRTRNFLEQHNHVAYNNNKRAFSYNVDDTMEEFTASILRDKYSLVDLAKSPDPVLRNFYSLMYTVTKGGEVVISNHMGKFLSEDPTIDEVKSKVKGMLWSSFNKENLRLKPEQEIMEILDNKRIIKNGEFVDLNAEESIEARRYMLKNSYFSDFKETERGSSLQDRYYWNKSSLVGIQNKTSKEVLVQFTDLTYGTVEIIETPDSTIISNTNDKEIYRYATYSRDFTQLTDKYDIEKGGFGKEGFDKWSVVQTPGFNNEYFNKLVNLYKEGRKQYGTDNLLHNEIPQVDRMEKSTKLQQAKEAYKKVKDGNGAEMIYDYAATYLVEENKSPRMKNGVYVDENDVPTNDPVYESKESQYINGQKIKHIQAKFTRPISMGKLETDLYKSVLMYKTASNVYRALKDNESQALLLQTVIEGDETLGIDPRGVKVKRNGIDVKVPGIGIKMKNHELNSSRMILSFLDDYLYNIDKEDYGILGSNISAKKVAGLVSKYTAFTALSWNFMTMPSNRIAALHNMRAVSKGNEFFNEEDFKKALAVYRSNIGGFFNDFKTKGFVVQKSPLTQLIIRFNAIQGEFLSPEGIIVSKNLGEKLSDNAYFWTQEIVEHQNQTNSMVMLMMGYKLPSGKSLWNAIQETNTNRVEGEELMMPEEFTKELEIEFQKRLHGVNRQIHGNYQQLDKTMLQKGILTNMLMTFKKYIYDGFRSRFMEERYDQELRDEQEGYFRTYLKSLNRDFSEIAKTQGMIAALKTGGLKTLGTSLLKTSLAGWDAASGRMISKNNKSASEFLYGKRVQDGGDITDRQFYASMRATYDIGNVIRAMLIVVVAEAIMSGLDEDDEELKFVLSYVDIYARKLESDIGFFTSFTNFATGTYGGATLDQMLRFMKEPFAAVRTMDNTAGIFKQLIDFDTINENGEFELSWGGLDRYDKSGNGFEKGDLKITRKLQKSVVSPWWQIIKLLSPEEQLKYLGLVTKYQN